MKNNILALLSLALALPSAAHAFSQEKNGIKISAKDFMNNPYAQVIENPNWTITAEDLQKHNIAAIKVKITNNTDKPICISGRSVRLSQAKTEDIASKFKKRTIIRPILAYLGANFITTNAIMMAKGFSTTAMTFEEGLTAGIRFRAENAVLMNTRWFMCLAGSIAYGFYLSDLNNQLEILLKQSSLNETTTIAPKQSVEKIIFCEGMLSQNFNFSIFNKSHVPVTDFTVDLCA